MEGVGEGVEAAGAVSFVVFFFLAFGEGRVRRVGFADEMCISRYLMWRPVGGVFELGKTTLPWETEPFVPGSF